MSVLYKALKRQAGAAVPISTPYRPQALHKVRPADGISQILLPARRAPLILLILVAVAAALIFLPDEPDTVPAARPAPMLAVARPATPAPEPMEPTVAAVAALMPPAAAATLPLDALKTMAPVHSLDISVRQPAAMPGGDDALTRQGIKLAQSGDQDGAEAALRGSLAKDPQNPLTLYNLAVLADRRGDTDTARTMYDRALHALQARPQAPMSAQLIGARLDQLQREGE